jgi:arsenate reductase
MAEGFARAWGLRASSAGVKPGRIHPLAIRVMAERGIDISNQTAKPLTPELLHDYETVITLCGDTADHCPLLPTVRRIHWPLPDPGKAPGSDVQRLETFRAVRDKIETLLQDIVHDIQAVGRS